MLTSDSSGTGSPVSTKVAFARSLMMSPCGDVRRCAIASMK